MMRAKTFIAIGAVGFATMAIAGDMARYEPVGKPVSCINTMNIQSTRILDDRTIEFKMSGRKVYHNVMDYKCSGLKSEDRFSYRTFSNNLCDVDLIHVLHDYGGRLENGVGCGLGKFQQVQKVVP